MAANHSYYIPTLQSHAGIDFHAPAGTPVHAVGNGVVMRVSFDPAQHHFTLKAMFDLVGISSHHLPALPVARPGTRRRRDGQMAQRDAIKDGDQVCLSGSVGALAPHLHLEVKQRAPDSGLSSAWGGSPLHLSREDLRSALAERDQTEREPAFFSFVGVSMYLAPAVLQSLLQLIASWAAATRLAFDYVVPLSHQPMTRLAYRFFLFRFARVGEPWQGFFEPEELRARIQALGFAQATDVAGSQSNARYFHGGRRAGRGPVGAPGFGGSLARSRSALTPARRSPARGTPPD